MAKANAVPMSRRINQTLKAVVDKVVQKPKDDVEPIKTILKEAAKLTEVEQ